MADKIKQLIRHEIEDLKGFCPGLADRTVSELKEILGRDEIIKLSFNENPYGSSPKAVQAIKDTAEYVHLYYDSESKMLREKLADMYNLHCDNFFFGDGADELIVLLAQAFLTASDEVIIPTPTFGQYFFAAKLMGAKPIAVSIDKRNMMINLTDIKEAITEKTKMIYLCNPNNPTGVMIGGKELKGFLSAVPEHVLVVLDEAYAEFVTDNDYLSGISLLNTFNNLVVLRTFSKIYGLAGLRVGYGITSSDIAAIIDRVRSPFNVNMIAQVAGAAALEDQNFCRKVSCLNAEERSRLTMAFRDMGFTVYESQTNFLFVDVKQNSSLLAEKLMDSGIIIRAGNGWGLPTHARISIGDKEQNDKILENMYKISCNVHNNEL